MTNYANPWTGKPVDSISDLLPRQNGQTCDECGSPCIDNCIMCGAPQCCPSCCYEDSPSARITGDKDRLVQSRALTDLTTRLHSFAKALETGFDFNVMKHLDVSMCCDGHMCGCQGSTVGQYLAHQLRGELPEEKLTEANRRLAIECHRLRSVLRWIADTAYVDQQSGNQNFENLQSIARDALTKEPTP